MTDLNINYIPIDTITKIKTIAYTQMTIKIIEMTFGENSATIQVNLLDELKDNIKSFIYIISGIDYLNWTTDNYIVNWVKSKLKLENF